MNLQQIKALQLTWLLPRLFSKSGLRRVFGLPISNFSTYAESVTDLNGLEVGGPSAVFRRSGPLPLYDLVKSLDNCNFTSNTIWEHNLSAGRTFKFSSAKPPGIQYVFDSDSLTDTPTAHYDFLLSCHMLEHSANPIRVLREWDRVLRPGGSLILLLPDKRWTFDHRRPVTTLDHLNYDFKNHTGEDDLTHVDEILRLHDLSRNQPVTREELEYKARHNLEIRSLHHHVFDASLVQRMLEFSGFNVRIVTEHFPYHIVALATTAPQTS